MAYFVVVSVEFRNPQAGDEDRVSRALERVGFRRSLVGGRGSPVRLPGGTFAGEFTGASSAKVRTDLAEQVQSALQAQGVKVMFFIAVGQNWAWGTRSS